MITFYSLSTYMVSRTRDRHDDGIFSDEFVLHHHNHVGSLLFLRLDDVTVTMDHL